MASAMLAIAAPASQKFITNTLHGSSGSSATLLQLRSELGARSISISIPIRGLDCGGLSAMMSRGGRNKGWHHQQLVRCKSPEVEKDEEEGFEMPANAPKVKGVEQLVGGGTRGVEKIFSNLNQATLKHEPGRFCCYNDASNCCDWKSVRKSVGICTSCFHMCNPCEIFIPNFTL